MSRTGHYVPSIPYHIWVANEGLWFDDVKIVFPRKLKESISKSAKSDRNLPGQAC